MAAPILCNGPDGGPAAVLITMLADGDTVGLCGPCLTDWAHAIVKATAPELLADAPKTPARRPRARAAAAPVAGTEDASTSGQGIRLVSDGGQANGDHAAG
jgi:hypothetical protein